MLVLLALTGAVQSKAAEFKTKLGDVAAGEVTLTCREPGGWTFALEREAGAGGVEIVRVRMSAAKPEVPPRFDVEVRFPAVDIPHLWKPEYSYDGVRPNWTSGDCRPSETSYAWWTPVYCLHNATDQNRFTFATSECVRKVGFRAAITEETLMAFLRFGFFREREAPLKSYETAIRLDRRNVFYGDAIREATDWILASREETPCLSPTDAFAPLYSSWYSFHQNVFDLGI